MALKVEDGTGLPNANTYCSLSEADKYHETRGNSAWALIGEERRMGLLVQATDFMVARYRLKWKGRRVKIEQALDWPRVGVTVEDMRDGGNVDAYGLMLVDFTIVPTEIKNACAELALRANIAALAKDEGPKVTSKTVGPIKVDYDKDSSDARKFPLVEMMLQPFFKLTSSGPMVKLTRT